MKTEIKILRKIIEISKIKMEIQKMEYDLNLKLEQLEAKKTPEQQIEKIEETIERDIGIKRIAAIDAKDTLNILLENYDPNTP